ncbi:hypothetical protein AlacWU_01540 [Aspergillus niger]|nr:hypothetical protein AlacWU_01540 [Aspergillus niger]
MGGNIETAREWYQEPLEILLQEVLGTKVLLLRVVLVYRRQREEQDGKLAMLTGIIDQPACGYGHVTTGGPMSRRPGSAHHNILARFGAGVAVGNSR